MIKKPHDVLSNEQPARRAAMPANSMCVQHIYFKHLPLTFTLSAKDGRDC